MNSETQNPRVANSILLSEIIAAIEPHQTPDGPVANQADLNITNMPVETPRVATSILLSEIIAAIEPHQTPDGPVANQAGLNITNMPVETPISVFTKFPNYYAPLDRNDEGDYLIEREEKINARVSYYRINNKNYFGMESDFVSYDSLVKVADDIESNYDVANTRISNYEKNIELTTDKIDDLYKALKIMKELNTTERDADESDESDDEEITFYRPYRVETGNVCNSIKRQINKAKEHIEQTRTRINDTLKHVNMDVLQKFRRTADMLKRIGDNTLKISDITDGDKKCIYETMVNLKSKKYSVYTIFYHYAKDFIQEIKRANEYFEPEQQVIGSDVIYYNRDQEGPVDVFRTNILELSRMMIASIEKLNRYGEDVVEVAFSEQILDLIDSISTYYLRANEGNIRESNDFFEDARYREYGSDIYLKDVDPIVYRNELAADARNDRVGVCCMCIDEKTLICRPACRCEPNKETGQLPDHVFICEECTTSQNEYNQSSGKAASCHICKHEY
jgi:hypothetical protein